MVIQSAVLRATAEDQKKHKHPYHDLEPVPSNWGGYQCVFCGHRVSGAVVDFAERAVSENKPKARKWSSARGFE